MTSTVKKRIRTMLLKKQGCKCPRCKQYYTFDFGTKNFPTLDHRIPKSKGGTDNINNLTLMCSACNLLKGNTI